MFKFILAMLLGIFSGVSAFTIFYAKGGSYFFDDPRTCANCHIMRGHFDAWNRASHKSVAVCNGCHTPKGKIGKYAVKGINGWNHSAAFTSGDLHEPIRIRPFNRNVALKNCRRCHEMVISQMVANSKKERAECILCHRNVGH